MNLTSKFYPFSWHWLNYLFFNSNKTYEFSTKLVFQMNVLFFSQNVLNTHRQGKWMMFSIVFQKIPKKVFFLGGREMFKVCDSSQTANNKGSWLAFYRLLVLLFFFLPLLGLITQNLWNYWKPFFSFVFLVLRECQKCKKSQLVSSSLDVAFHCSPKMRASFFIRFPSKTFLLVGEYNTNSHTFWSWR